MVHSSEKVSRSERDFCGEIHNVSRYRVAKRFGSRSCSKPEQHRSFR